MTKTKNLLFLLFVLSFIAVLSLFHSGLPITHDGQDHVARIANFYQNLLEGNVIPRWAANLNWGYGHPVLEFLYPLPSYIASFFHFLGFSLIDSTKIVFGMGVILSGLFMYVWLSEFLSFQGAFLGSTLYMFAPYRFVDLYVRGDIGENLAFVFIPLVLYFILKMSKKLKLKYIVLGSVSVALLILSHNAISLMFMPFIVFYGLYLWYISKERKPYLVNLAVLVILGLSLSAFFWIPGLFEGKYTLRNIVTAGGYKNNFVALQALLYGPWSFGGSGLFTVQLGILQWLALVLSPFLTFITFKRKDKEYILSLLLTAYTLVAIFLMLKQSNFIWESFTILQNFQFPWRFLAVTVFSTSTLAALLISEVSKKHQTVLTIILVVLVLFLSRDFWHANGYLEKKDSFFTGIYRSTTDTGESAPIWSVRFMEQEPKAPIEVILGGVKITNLDRKVTKHLYEIEAFEKSRIRENTLYFPGWKVKVDGKPVNIEFQDQKNRGLMTFFVGKGKHYVSVEFWETKLRFFADLISLAAMFFVLFYSMLWRSKLWQHFL